MIDLGMTKVPKTPSEIGPSFEKFTNWRPEQDKVVEKLLSSSKKFLLLEAPTGSGKTLVGASIHKLKNLFGTVYCCNTKLLQDQFMRDFEAFSVTLKGKANYPCLQPGIESAKTCIHRKEMPCEFREECEYYLKVEEARNSELAVLNTWVLLNQIEFAQRFTNKTWREDELNRNLLILDEADTLEEVLVGFASREITNHYINTNHLTKPNLLEVSIPYWVSWAEENLNLLEARLPRISSEGEKNKLLVVIQNLSFLYNSLSTSWVVETIPNGICLIPTDTASLADKYIFQHFTKILLMSASFCGPDLFTKILGIPKEDYEYFSIPSYFPIEKRPIYYIPIVSMTNSSEEENFGTMVEALDFILKTFKDSQTIIHTVSTSRATKFKEALSTNIEVYTAQDKFLLGSFRSKEVRVIASPSLDRGYDFPEDLCRINIIAKIPYPYLGSESVKARSKNNKRWYSWQTIQKIVQMTGRSTRSSKDFSLCFILDKKFKDLIEKDGDLFPKWWVNACRGLETVKSVNYNLLEEAENG